MLSVKSYNSDGDTVTVEVSEQPVSLFTEEFKLGSIHSMDYDQCLQLYENYRV